MPSITKNNNNRAQSVRSTLSCNDRFINPEELTFGDVLGQGSSGVTYLGQYHGEEVAIKKYSNKILEYDLKSVCRELDIMSQIPKHENIVEVVGICIVEESSGPQVCLVTKLAKKGDLQQAMYSRSYGWRGMEDSLRCKIAIGLAKGLKLLHKQNIVHRDLKPANILLNENDEVAIMDFGFSRWMDGSECMTGETGSYRYMAPEMIRSEKYDDTVDTYSFGIILNELFTRKKPFQDEMPIRAALDVASRGVRPSQKGIKDQELKQLIWRCWEQNSADRPEWNYIIDELEAISGKLKRKRSEKRRVSISAGKRIMRSAVISIKA